jgi:hypothetical protein
MKQITITVPDNCELKQDGNTYTIVKKEKLTYESIRDKKLPNQFYIRNDIQCTTSRQYQKLLAINKLMNLAKWLNGSWQPNWHDYYERKYYICYDNIASRLRIDSNDSDQNNFVYFKSEELAQQAIEILGEETIKLALCTDY